MQTYTRSKEKGEIMMKNRTSVSKFEEFLKNKYHKEIFDIFEKLLDGAPFILDYNELEKFDKDLADLLIEKPEEVIEAVKTAIGNIDPLIKNAEINICFKNVSNFVPIEKINSRHIGNLITTRIHVKEVNDVETTVKTAVLECTHCMRLHKVEQKYGDEIVEPSLCSDCGGRSFKLLPEESTYVDTQIITVSSNDKAYPSIFVLEDKLVGQLKLGDDVEVTGILKTKQLNKKVFEKYFKIMHFQILENEDEYFREPSEDLSDDVRGSKEYDEWRNHVINRDQVCQCCGGHKHLEVHHIFSYKNNPDYRLNPDNGIVLCKWCHGKYHSYYGKNATPSTLIEFCKSFGNVIIKINDYDLKEAFEKINDKSTEKKMKDIVIKPSKDSSKDILERVLSEIKLLEEEYAGLCPINVLKANFCVDDMPEEKMDDILRSFREKGIIQEAQEGYLKYCY